MYLSLLPDAVRPEATNERPIHPSSILIFVDWIWKRREAPAHRQEVDSPSSTKELQGTERRRGLGTKSAAERRKKKREEEVPVDCLEIDEWVPIMVVDNDVIRCCQIDAQASCSRGNQIDEVAGIIVVEIPNVQLPHEFIRRAVQPNIEQNKTQRGKKTFDDPPIRNSHKMRTSDKAPPPQDQEETQNEGQGRQRRTRQRQRMAAPPVPILSPQVSPASVLAVGLELIQYELELGEDEESLYSGGIGIVSFC